MTIEEIRAAYDRQIRQHPETGSPGGVVERTPHVVRFLGEELGWGGVTWSDLDEGTADAAIAEQIERFVDVPFAWEWKHYSYDQPPDLADRLVAAGFRAEPPETLMVAQVSDLDLEVVLPEGVRLHDITHPDDVRLLMRAADEAFGARNPRLAAALETQVRDHPDTIRAVVALAGDRPVSGGRLELARGTDFASIWGGGTVPGWRGKGLFRALVAHRAAQAAAEGFRYLQVDAAATSRPILEHLGFVPLATTTPYERESPAV